MSLLGSCVLLACAVVGVATGWLLLGRLGRRCAREVEAAARPKVGERYVDAPGFPHPPHPGRRDDDASS